MKVVRVKPDCQGDGLNIPYIIAEIPDEELSFIRHPERDSSLCRTCKKETNYPECTEWCPLAEE